jgi:hypothetical protein
MPSADELPAPLTEFARRHALELSDVRWRYDVDRLASTAERVLGSERSAGRERADRREPAAGHRAARRHADDRAGSATANDARRRPGSGWVQSHRRLAIAAPLLAVLVGVGAVVLASGGGDGASSKRLSELIPPSVEEKCDQAENFWLEEDDAVEQRDCVLPDGVGITYGLFRNLGAAQAFVENDFDAARTEQNAKSCGPEVEGRLEKQYSGGNPKCYTDDDRVTINWSYSADPVGVQLVSPGTSVDAAVAARKKLLR